MGDTTNPGLFDRFLNAIERAGNRLPDPAIIFMALCGIILAASWLAAMTGWSATHPTTGATIEAVNLLNGDGFKRIVSEAVANFSAFPPLTMVLIAMLGVGVAEKSGWFETLMRLVVERAPNRIIIPVIIFVAIVGNAAGDAGPIVLPPIAAMVFMRLGYHPVAGLVTAYASCLGAFAANLLLGMTDVLALAFTQPAAASVDPDVPLNVAMNYYFIAVATLMLLATSYFVTTRFTIPRMGSFTPEPGSDLDHEDAPITDLERRGVRLANITVGLVTLALLVMTVPESGLLRNAETGSLTQDSPLMNGIIFLVSMLNLVIGSASAKWAILAPIFVPMLMYLGFHPAFTQMLYRIGDSITNPITPMVPYMPLLLSFAQRYVKGIGMGTLIAALMPYSIAFATTWVVMILLWYFAGWPLGPDGLIFYDAP